MKEIRSVMLFADAFNLLGDAARMRQTVYLFSRQEKEDFSLRCPETSNCRKIMARAKFSISPSKSLQKSCNVKIAVVPLNKVKIFVSGDFLS